MRPPLLDREWELKDLKPKPKSRPLPPTPVSHLQLTRRVEAARGKDVAQGMQPTSHVQKGFVPFGFFGKPVFTRPEPSSKPLPPLPTSDTCATHTTQGQEADIPLEEDLFEEDPEEESGWWGLTDYLLDCEVDSDSGDDSDMTMCSTC